MKDNFGKLNIETLQKLEYKILQAIKKENWKSVDINYHDPRVERVWTTIKHEDRNIRVHLHVIHLAKDSKNCLYHKHRWPAVMKQIKGSYEMGITYSESEISSEEAHQLPNLVRFILNEGSYYEMNHTDCLHYVRPLITKRKENGFKAEDYSLSIMLTEENEMFPEATFRKESAPLSLRPLPDDRIEYILGMFHIQIMLETGFNSKKYYQQKYGEIYE